MTPGRRRVKSPIPETTPTRLRQHITMTTAASPSILGRQRSRKPSPPLEVTSDSTLAAAEVEVVPADKPSDVPAITVDPASAYALAQSQPNWEQQPPMRRSPQLDAYHPYAGRPPYLMGDGNPHFQAHDPYYPHTTSPYLPNVGLAPPPHAFMRSQSPNGGYMMPQRSEGAQVRPNSGFLEDMSSSDWVTSGYSDRGVGHPESRLQTPSLLNSPLPPNPIELTSTGRPSLTVSEQPHITTPNSSTMIKDTDPAVSPLNEAPDPPAPFPPDKMSNSPEEAHEAPAVSPKSTQGAGGRPTTKVLGFIDEGFSRIMAIIEELAEVTGKPPSDLYRRLEKSRKGSSDGQLWNIYLHYFARHEDEEAGRINKSLQRTQAFRSQCYAQYKADHPNFQELLETYHALEMANTEMTVGQRKREVEKYEKKLRDMVS
jgi:hypothetical protein